MTQAELLNLIKKAKDEQWTKLDLSYKNLTEIPAEIGQLTNLTYLYLHGNQLTQLPETISQLTNLTELWLSGNQLTQLPETISQLTNLEKLDLSYNRLTQLPETIGQLTNLTYLDLEGNQLKQLPETIGQLTKLETLKLKGNPIEEPPAEMFDYRYRKYSLNYEGYEIVQKAINYFAQMQEQGSGRLYEAKILFVGEPGAGKTSLMKKLWKADYPIPSEEKSTLGIDIRAGWAFPYLHDKNIEFKANMWDFGGQEIQYMMHQFFLTSRSLYILLVDDRKQLTNFDYWFHIIHLLGGGSPVLVVLNKRNFKSVTNFDIELYRRQFPELNIESLTVDLGHTEDDNRFSTLKTRIQQMLSDLPHIGDKLPAKWIPIREDLEKLKKEGQNHITLDEYYQICEKHTIKKEEYKLQISDYLHCLGIIIHYQNEDDLLNMVILNPHWAVDAVYTVLSSKYLQDNRGIFEREWLFDLWQKKKYSRQVCSNLLNLMLKDYFELCYPLDNGKTKFLVPLVLPTIKPAFDWDEKDNLKFRFQYPFMPHGIITRLMVRLNELIDEHDGNDIIWRHGVVLKKDGNRALVYEDTSRRDGLKVIQISISGKASTKRDFLAAIRREVEAIHHKSFKNIPFSEMIPCNCDECKQSTEPHFFEYKLLLNYQDKNESKIICEKSIKKVSVRGLIEGVMHQEKSVDHGGNFRKDYRKKKERERLQEKWDLVNEKLSQLATALDLETDTSVQFKLKKQIEDIKKERKELEDELGQIESDLLMFE